MKKLLIKLYTEILTIGAYTGEYSEWDQEKLDEIRNVLGNDICDRIDTEVLG